MLPRFCIGYHLFRVIRYHLVKQPEAIYTLPERLDDRHTPDIFRSLPAHLFKRIHILLHEVLRYKLHENTHSQHPEYQRQETDYTEFPISIEYYHNGCDYSHDGCPKIRQLMRKKFMSGRSSIINRLSYSSRFVYIKVSKRHIHKPLKGRFLYVYFHLKRCKMRKHKRCKIRYYIRYHKSHCIHRI